MATPKKMKNGTWCAQVYIGRTADGKRKYVRVTAPTKSEWLYKAVMAKDAGLPAEPSEKLTVGQAIDLYIESCATLSPTTIAGYRKIRRTMFQNLMEEDALDVSSETLQRAINAEMRRKGRSGNNISAKSIKNAYGLVAASLRYVCGTSYNVKLPKEEPKFLELPDPAEVIKAVRGSDIELPCMLALWLSLSMSEVRGLKYSSIRNGCIYIDQVLVDVDGVATEKKRAKVASRNRVLELPEYLFDLIKAKTCYNDYAAGKIEDDYLVKCSHDTISKHLKKLLPGMTFHQLRHMNASIMLQLGVPDKYAMERGGWSTPSVMKRVYQHTFSSARKAVDNAIDTYFLDKMQQNMQQ